MSTGTDKPIYQGDANNVLRHAYNFEDASVTVNGFLVGQVGHKVTMAISTTSIANDTETYTFLNGATTLYTIKVIYTTGTRDVFLSAERMS